ncbi:retrovirus-related pol polyprotein from transposon TNT 1-94 [Tanacetum coccineum]
MEKDFLIYKGKKEKVKSIALKAKKESSDDETSTSRNDNEEYAMVIRNFKKFFRRKGGFVRQPQENKKLFCKGMPLQNTKEKAFVEGSWSDSKNKDEDKTNEETCLMPQPSNEVTLESPYFSDNSSSLDDDTTQIEYNNLPKNVNEALGDESWVVAIQEELNQFVENDVWDLVPLPKNQSIIGTKWVFRNKLDENGIVSRNKDRLVAQGYNQQEGIDYDETYASVARL